jgi:hypothetical protein
MSTYTSRYVRINWPRCGRSARLSISSASYITTFAIGKAAGQAQGALLMRILAFAVWCLTSGSPTARYLLAFH